MTEYEITLKASRLADDIDRYIVITDEQYQVFLGEIEQAVRSVMRLGTPNRLPMVVM